MNNEQNPQEDFNSSYEQTLAFGNPQPGLSIISEDEKVTLRMPPSCPEAGDLFESDLYPYQPFDSVVSQPNDPAQQASGNKWVESTNEIALDQLNPNDQLIIETTHSLYSFTVVNPNLLYGKLIGGILGNQIAGATLKFSCSENENPVFTAQRLKLGMSIVFNIEWGNSLRQLMTSTITRLQLRSGNPYDIPTIPSEKRASNSGVITQRMDELER